MESDKKYYAFISYKREDEEWAKWLQYKLEHYKLPSNLNGRTDLPKEIRPVFKDTSELNPGNLPQQIHDALEQSKYLIVICSPRSARSEWVNREVETFMEMGRTDKIIPFIIEGNAFSKNPETECFPMALRTLPSDQEILGANINEMGRDAAAVKVVSQMFGVKFDELWQRYEREQRRRRFLIIAAALLLALVGIGVAVGFSRQNKKITEQNERITKQNEEIVKQSEDIQRKNDRLTNDSVIMAAQMDSIKTRDAYIVEQQDSIAQTNVQLNLERDNLKKANWQMMESKARFVSEKAIALAEEGDSYLARLLLLEVLPENLDHPNSPYVIEAEYALRVVTQYDNAILAGHTNWVTSASFSPDGKRIVSISWDKTIRIWDAETGQQIGQPLEGHGMSHVNSASFSPDSKRIVSASSDKTIRLWDAKTGQQIGQPLEGHTDIVTSASFSPDGKRIVSASWDSSIRIWDAETGQQIGQPLEGHTDIVESASFSPDGKRIVSASASWDRTIRIWDAETGQPIGQPLRGHTGGVESASFSPDGKRIISASDDNTMRIWDAETGQQIGQPLKGHTDNVSSASFSPDGKRIVSASDDGTIKIWYFPPLQDLIDETRERFKDRPLTPEERYQYYLE